MKVSEIMTTPVISARVDQTIREASTLLAEHCIASMPVLDAAGSVVGMVSEIDLLRNRIPHDPRAHLNRHDDHRGVPGRLVRDVMSDAVVCLSENADAADVVELMITNRIRAIPIISGPDLVGIVSRRDLLRSLMRDDETIRTEVQDRLSAYAEVSEACEVDVSDGVVTISGHFTDDRRREAMISITETVPGVVRVLDRSR